MLRSLVGSEMCIRDRVKSLDDLQFQNKPKDSEKKRYLKSIKKLENALKEEQAQTLELKEMFQILGNLGIPVSDICFRQKMMSSTSKREVRRKSKMRSLFLPKIPIDRTPSPND